MTDAETELQKFKFSAAVQMWAALPGEDQDRLLSLPKAKEEEIEWVHGAKKFRGRRADMAAYNNANPQESYSGGHYTGVTFSDPDLDRLVALGLALSGPQIERSSCVWNGLESHFSRYVDQYSLSPLGRLVAGYGRAKRLVDRAAELLVSA